MDHVKSVQACGFYLVAVTAYPSFVPSFPSALQLRVSFGLLNNLPAFFSTSI
jgi:hypothetical protein